MLDLSSAASPPPWPPDWKGLWLGAGTATGETTVPDPCNTGYLRGHYTYDHANVVSSGFFGSIYLASPVSFNAINPLGQSFTFNDAAMDIWYSKIVRGELKNGWTDLPVDAVTERAPGRRVRTPIDVVSIQPDLDLAGALDHGGREISWGELTHHGDEVVAWTGVFGRGYLYLPAGPVPSYSPVAGGTFSGPSISSVVDASLAELEAHQVAGVTFPQVSGAYLFSPDRPGARANPIKLNQLQGWIRVGITGVDGALSTYLKSRREELGDPAGTGYDGNVAFVSTLFVNDRLNQLAEFVTSASHDSHVGGTFEIPTPCNIPQLPFTQLKLTSTGCLVGGDLVLPAAGRAARVLGPAADAVRRARPGRGGERADRDGSCSPPPGSPSPSTSLRRSGSPGASCSPTATSASCSSTSTTGASGSTASSSTRTSSRSPPTTPP